MTRLLRSRVPLTRRVAAPALGACCALVGACSFVNSYDDVLQEPAGTGAAGTSAGGATGGGTTDGGADSGGAAGGDGGAMSGGGAAGSSGDGGSGGEEVVPEGLLVASAIDNEASDAAKLVVVSPQDGSLLAEEEMRVLGIVHDPQSSLWYIFEDTGGLSTAPSPSASRDANLHVRSFSRETNTWTPVLATPIQVPPPKLVSPDVAVALTDRLAYVSASDELVIVDTTTPSSIPLPTPATINAGGIPIGVVGQAQSGVGGTINILRRDQDLTDRTLQASRVLINDSGFNEGAVNDLGSFATTFNAAFGRVVSDELHVIFPRQSSIGTSVTPETSATVQRFALVNQAPIGSPVSIGVETSFNGFAYDPCANAVFDSQTTNVQLRVTDLDTGDTDSVTTTINSKQLVYEPATRTVVAGSRTDANFEWRAFDVSGDDGAIDFAASSTFTAPTNLGPLLVVAKTPTNATQFCP